jgi:diacylglycerol kinase family enzyme
MRYRRCDSPENDKAPHSVNPRTAIDLAPLDRVLIVCNPSAGSRHRADDIRDLKAALEECQLVPEIVTDLEAIGPLAAALQQAGRLRAIVAAGGDGTVAEVVNRTTSTTPVTVFPLGTANLLAGYFGIRRDARAMAQMIAAGSLVRLDAGQANGRVFLLMAGCGFDADVVQRLHNRRRGGHISYWTWAQPILQSIRSYKYPVLRVTSQPPDENQAEMVQTAHWAFAVNMPVYAAGLTVAPQASGSDGLFDVCTFDGGSLWHGLKYVAHIFLRRHERLSAYKCHMATRVRFEADEPVPYQLDGDPGGMLPLEITMLRARITLLVPATRARALQLPANTPETVGA